MKLRNYHQSQIQAHIINCKPITKTDILSQQHIKTEAKSYQDKLLSTILWGQKYNSTSEIQNQASLLSQQILNYSKID